MTATFCQDEWNVLSVYHRRALGRLAGAGTDFETTGKLAGISDEMADKMVNLGYAEKGQTIWRNQTGYRLNDKGWLAYGWGGGRRQTVVA